MDIQERLSLDAVTATTLESSEHLHRYDLAASLIKGKRVLDLCCGIGYGSRILARTAASVVGVDRDAGAIDTARTVAHESGDVRFETAEAVAYLADCGAEFDAIVCFEGLEHLDRLDAATEILVTLAEAGTAMLLSVPNSKAFHEDNPFHVTDFGYEEALELFARFEGSVMLHQHVAEGSLISATADADLDADLVLADHGEPEYANNFLCAVNLGESVGTLASARAHLTIAPWHNRYLTNVERANRELRQTNARLARERLGRYDSAAAAVQGKLQEMEQRAETAEQHARELDEQLQAVWERTRFAEQLVDRQRMRAEAAEAKLTPKRLFHTRRLARRASKRLGRG